MITKYWNYLQATSLIRSYMHSSLFQWIGEGMVQISNESNNICIFDERGKWKSQEGIELEFFNQLRWTLVDQQIFLEHLRYGLNQPVLLAAFKLSGKGHYLQSTKDYFCGKDSYKGVIFLHSNLLVVRWSISGPAKKQTINYEYS
jgi:hypothetical protein